MNCYAPRHVPALANHFSLLQRLAAYLDRPLFPWKKLIMGFSIGQFALETFLSFRQYRVLSALKPPAVLAKEVSQETFEKSQAYGRAKTKFSVVSGFISQALNISFMYFDVLPKLWSWTGGLLLKWSPTGFRGEISHSVLFMVVFLLLQQVLAMPVDIYSHFVLEEKYGFNKQTPQLYATDQVKNAVLTSVLVSPVLAGCLKIIQKTGNQFVFYVWSFSAAAQLFLQTIFPIYILPIFNKLTPIEDGELKSRVDELASKLKFPLKELYVMDGSKRSAHSNAFFAGLPWSKRIVLFDTLIDSQDTDEIMAVLAHELGHWKLQHTAQHLGVIQVNLLKVFALFSVFINNASLYSSFGFHTQHPVIVGFLLFNDALSPMDTVIHLIINSLSRKWEFQADEFAKDLGYETQLCTGLIKLHKQNLSSMDADWLYATYHFSHPHLSERLKALNWKSERTVVEEKLDKEGVAVATGRDEL